MRSILIAVILFLMCGNALTQDYRQDLYKIKPLLSLKNSTFTGSFANLLPVQKNATLIQSTTTLSLRNSSHTEGLPPLSQRNAKTAANPLLVASLFAWPLNPMLVVENEKAYFGLTKEVSLLFVLTHLGRIGIMTRPGIEYSYIFRESRNNHLRGFLDFVYPVQTGDFAAFLLMGGPGYFTDFTKSGISAQLSFGLILPVEEHAFLHIYIKGRYTFMTKKTESDITDISLGLGFGLN